MLLDRRVCIAGGAWGIGRLHPTHELYGRGCGCWRVRAGDSVLLPVEAPLAAVGKRPVGGIDGRGNRGQGSVAGVDIGGNITGSVAEGVLHLVAVGPGYQKKRACHGSSVTEASPTSAIGDSTCELTNVLISHAGFWQSEAELESTSGLAGLDGSLVKLDPICIGDGGE